MGFVMLLKFEKYHCRTLYWGGFDGGGRTKRARFAHAQEVPRKQVPRKEGYLRCHWHLWKQQGTVRSLWTSGSWAWPGPPR